MAREILLVLAIKAVALFGIWWMWFSAPEARYMRLPGERVQQRLVDAREAALHRPSPAPPRGNRNHASD